MGSATAWLLLAGTIACELVGTTAIPASAGFSRWPTLVVVVGYGASLYLLSRAVQAGMQVSVAYAVWSGFGTAAIAVIGAVWLREPLTVAKVAGIVLVIAGVVVLNLSAAPARPEAGHAEVPSRELVSNRGA